MKTKLFAVVLLAIAFVVQSPKSNAQSPYKQGEVTIETFATYSQPKAKFNDAFDKSFRQGTWGAGIGGAYWFHRNFSLGADAVVMDGGAPADAFFDQINLNLSARYPIGETGFAPYATVGAGRHTETGEYTTHVAAGLEYRFANVPVVKRLGVFAEGRYQWAGGNASDIAQARAGLRFAF